MFESKYTFELRSVCEDVTREEVEKWFSSYELSDYLTSTQITTITEANLFDKNKLAKKIVNHYFMREIGFETIALFKLNVIEYMEELMEEYLPLIYSKCIEFDPLKDIDIVREHIKSKQGESSGNVGTTSNDSTNMTSLNIRSDTPQGQISKSEILNGEYASQTSSNESESTSNSNTNTNSNANSNENETYRETETGSRGGINTSQKLIMEYRKIIVPFEKEIINKCSVLFMGIY